MLPVMVINAPISLVKKEAHRMMLPPPCLITAAALPECLGVFCSRQALCFGFKPI